MNNKTINQIKLKQNRKNEMKINKKSIFKNKNASFLLLFSLVAAGLVLGTSDVLAVQDAPDQGLSTGVTNLLAILNNKLTPVILIAGCLASIVYSLAIAQPKPFILGLVTLCGFGFAKAWITGTYALIG